MACSLVRTLTRRATSELAAVAATEAQHPVGDHVGIKDVAAGPQLRPQLLDAGSADLVRLLGCANHSLQHLAFARDGDLIATPADGAVRGLRSAGPSLAL